MSLTFALLAFASALLLFAIVRAALRGWGKWMRRLPIITGERMTWLMAARLRGSFALVLRRPHNDNTVAGDAA